MWGCTTIDDYEVCILLWVNTSYFWSCIIVVSSKLSENSDENRCSPSHESTIQVSNTSTSSVPAPVLLSQLFRYGALSIDFFPFPSPRYHIRSKKRLFHFMYIAPMCIATWVSINSYYYYVLLGNVKKRRGREPFEWRLQESFVNVRGHQPIQLLYVFVYATVFVIPCIFIYFLSRSCAIINISHYRRSIFRCASISQNHV